LADPLPSFDWDVLDRKLGSLWLCYCSEYTVVRIEKCTVQRRLIELICDKCVPDNLITFLTTKTQFYNTVIIYSTVKGKVVKQ
jgi:hypothetical protein